MVFLFYIILGVANSTVEYSAFKCDSIFYTFIWSKRFVHTIGKVCKTATDPEGNEWKKQHVVSRENSKNIFFLSDLVQINQIFSMLRRVLHEPASSNEVGRQNVVESKLYLIYVIDLIIEKFASPSFYQFMIPSEWKQSSNEKKEGRLSLLVRSQSLKKSIFLSHGDR